METTIGIIGVYWVIWGKMEKNMETTIMGNMGWLAKLWLFV